MLRVCGIATLLAAMFLAMLPAAPVGATNYSVAVTTTVNTNNPCAATGTAPCSLRDAVRYANTHPGASDTTTITLPANINLYKLDTQLGVSEDNAATGDLDIKANVTINGGGASATIIDGNQSDRVFQIFAGFTVNISDVTIQNGLMEYNVGGGGIFVAANAIVTLTGCIVANNVVNFSIDEGGGIFNIQGTVTLNSTTLSNNVSTLGGGGIYNNAGTMVVNNSIINGTAC